MNPEAGEISPHSVSCPGTELLAYRQVAEPKIAAPSARAPSGLARLRSNSTMSRVTMPPGFLKSSAGLITSARQMTRSGRSGFANANHASRRNPIRARSQCAINGAQLPLSFRMPLRMPCEMGSSGASAPRLPMTSTTYGPEASWTIRPVFPPSNLTSFMMLSAVACAYAATIAIDGTGELRFSPSNPNRPCPDDVFGKRVGREPHHRQSEGRTQGAAGRQRLDGDRPHPNDENEHDHDPRETPKAESCGYSQ